MDDLSQRFAGMTVGELSKIGGRSVADLVLYALGKAGAAAPAAPARPTKAPSKPAKGVDVRTPGGRAAYDAAIVEALRNAKGPLRSGDLRARVGGNAAQLRQRLNVLIEKGEVTYSGVAAATKYEAV